MIDSILNGIAELICGWFISGAVFFFNLYNSIIGSITANSVLTAPFSSLLGDNVYALTTTIHQTVVVPIAESILALFMLVQLVKISQRIDANATLPAVKDIVFLAVTYVLLHWFIVNSLGVMQAVYQIVVDEIIPGIGDVGNLDTAAQITAEGVTSTDFGACIALFFASIICFLIGIIAYVISLVVAYARAWQIYVMAAFSSIPVALLGFDETRASGIQFLKNFASAVLAGALMVFLLVAYPSILTSVAPGLGITQGILDVVTGDAATDGLLGALSAVALGVLLIIGLVKSGAWAKEILGS